MLRTASGLLLLPQSVVARNARAWDHLLHLPVRPVLEPLKLCGCHAILRLPKVNLLAIRGSREVVVEMPPVGHASIVVVKATILGIVPHRRRMGPAMLQTLKLPLLLIKPPRMGKIPSVAMLTVINDQF